MVSAKIFYFALLSMVLAAPAAPAGAATGLAKEVQHALENAAHVWTESQQHLSNLGELLAKPESFKNAVSEIDSQVDSSNGALSQVSEACFSGSGSAGGYSTGPVPGYPAVEGGNGGYGGSSTSNSGTSVGGGSASGSGSAGSMTGVLGSTPNLAGALFPDGFLFPNGQLVANELSRNLRPLMTLLGPNIQRVASYVQTNRAHMSQAELSQASAVADHLNYMVENTSKLSAMSLEHAVLSQSVAELNEALKK